MERRVRSLAEVLSGVYHFLQEQKTTVPRSFPEFGPLTPSSASRCAVGVSGRKGRKTTAAGGGAALMDVDGAGSSEGELGGAMSGDLLARAALAERPPLNLLADSEVVEALWSGRKSMMRRLLRKLDTVYSEKLIVETPVEVEVSL